MTRNLPDPSPTGPRVEIGEWFSIAWRSLTPVWLEVVLAVLVGEAMLFVAALLCYLPALVLGGPVLAGLYIYLAKRILGLPAEVGDVFKGFRKFTQTVLLFGTIFLVPAVVVGFLFAPFFVGLLGWDAAGAGEQGAGLVGSLGCLGCGFSALLVALYPVVVGTFAIFAYPLVLFRNMNALDALRESFRLTRSSALSFFLLLLSNLLVVAIADIVGTLLACLGTLVTVPFATALVLTMHLLAFRQFAGLDPSDLEPYE